MRRYSAVIVLMALSAGCMHDKKPETQPPPVATTPETATPQPATAAPATGTKTPSSTTKPVAGAPAKPTTAKTPAKPATASSKPAPASSKPAPASSKPATATAKTTTPAKTAAPPLDLDALEARLRQTKAIGVMTKISLKNQVDDLLGKFRKHYAGNATPTMPDLRRSYDMLMMKVLSLLQDQDQQLASDILSSRERIWGLLADPKSFAAVTA